MAPLPPPNVPPPIPDDPSKVSHTGAGPQVNAVQWTLFIVATVVLALRLYAKKMLGSRGLWWDDYIIIAAYTVHFVACVLLSVMLAQGFGKHPWDYIWGTPREILLQWVRNTLAMTAAAWSKTAFAVTLLRLTFGWQKWFVWFILISMNIIIAINATMNWVGCDPIQKSWDPATPGTCDFDRVLPIIIFVGNLGGGYSAACDFVLAMMPWLIIGKLSIRTREKVGIGIAMSLGVAAGVMALLKTLHLTNLATGDSYDAAVLNIWDSAEISVTIIAASIPPLRVLLKTVFSTGGESYAESGPRDDDPNKPRTGFNRGGRRKTDPNKLGAGLGSDESIPEASGNKIARADGIAIKHDDLSEDERSNAHEMHPLRNGGHMDFVNRM
ncbi:hypothetical protein QBC43DRAFT_373786 [Cladorrhinum sp. PSN259]|nr:hypothetical protein QBC43DRAFT_373786 [Cladorrhinum sp. PSN259]